MANLIVRGVFIAGVSAAAAVAYAWGRMRILRTPDPAARAAGSRVASWKLPGASASLARFAREPEPF